MDQSKIKLIVQFEHPVIERTPSVCRTQFVLRKYIYIIDVIGDEVDTMCYTIDLTIHTY